MKNRTINKKILLIVGPTASGKSALGVKLAKILGGEVISADSRQVYTGLDIGTGKITRAEMRGVKHHLLDVANPKTTFSASDFTRLAREAIADIQNREKLPIIVGGAGFYIDALTGRKVLPEVPPNPTLRVRLEKNTTDALYKQLIKKDPRRAAQIDPRNKVRIVRALEIINALGKVPVFKPIQRKDHQEIWIGLTLPQAVLDNKIRWRLMQRLEEGMITEVEQLHKKGLSYKRMQALGLEYKYIALYLQKKISKDMLIEELFTQIRRYAKRQMTWFTPNHHIHWFTPPLSLDDLSAIRLLLE